MGAQLFSSARAVRTTDIGVAVWIAVWVVVGVFVWHDIGAQAGLATDVIKVGGAVRQTGDALGVVGGLPLVGGQIGSFADRIKTMGAEVETSGQDSRDATRRAAVVAGLAAGILPAAMVLLLYLPVRLRWRRDVAAVAAALPGAAGDPALDVYLARRALAVAAVGRAALGHARPVRARSSAATAAPWPTRSSRGWACAGRRSAAGPPRHPSRGSYFTVSRLLPSGFCAALPLRSRASTVKR